ncbi:MAG TPA: holo-ACP synthase [Firmicutes bacterium]|nr:holo-ACP synthase [Bacillota bacterium]
MSVRCGVDLVEVERVAKALADGGAAFQSRVFTPDEVQYCEARGTGKAQSYAARFAAKEALAKALGTGISQGVAWNEIEVAVDELGRPELRFHGRTAELVRKAGVTGCSVSLSHSAGHAVAVVVLES